MATLKFNVRISKIRVLDWYSQGDTKFYVAGNFDDTKRFRTDIQVSSAEGTWHSPGNSPGESRILNHSNQNSNLQNRNDNNNNPSNDLPPKLSCSWPKYTMKFIYECPSICPLDQRILRFRLKCPNKLLKDETIGECRTDLLSIANGPSHYEGTLLGTTAGKAVGKIQFNIEMEQIADVSISIESAGIANLPLLNGIKPNIQLYYGYSATKNQIPLLKSTKSKASASPEWKNLSPVNFTTTRNALWNEGIYVEVYAKYPPSWDDYLLIGGCTFLFNEHEDLSENLLLTGSLPLSITVHALAGSSNCSVQLIWRVKGWPVYCQDQYPVSTPESRSRPIHGRALSLPPSNQPLHCVICDRPTTNTSTQTADPICSQECNARYLLLRNAAESDVSWPLPIPYSSDFRLVEFGPVSRMFGFCVVCCQPAIGHIGSGTRVVPVCSEPCRTKARKSLDNFIFKPTNGVPVNEPNPKTQEKAHKVNTNRAVSMPVLPFLSNSLSPTGDRKSTVDTHIPPEVSQRPNLTISVTPTHAQSPQNQSNAAPPPVSPNYVGAHTLDARPTNNIVLTHSYSSPHHSASYSRKLSTPTPNGAHTPSAPEIPETTSSSPSPRQRASSVSTPIPTEWVCNTCTLINDMNSTRCNACTSRRPVAV